jgi:hypothetical protein
VFSLYFFAAPRRRGLYQTKKAAPFYMKWLFCYGRPKHSIIEPDLPGLEEPNGFSKRNLMVGTAAPAFIF